MYAHVAGRALLAPVAFLLWIVYLDWRTPIAEIHELDLFADSELEFGGILSKLLPPGVVMYRATCRREGTVHRAPDFQVWLERVPQDCRVVVLALSPLTRFDTNAVMDLEAAVTRLHEEKKKLILAGVTKRQYEALEALGVAPTMDMNNVCPDLEFAIARSMALMEEMTVGVAA
jgi:anti-anti-sigma regulatory factor